MLKIARLPNGSPEVFGSIQGEGPSCGIPSVFIRLATCNLRCRWCDTSYTWDWTQYDPALEIVSLAASSILPLVAATGIHNAVITGGEPLLQQRELIPLVEGLSAAGKRIEVETNGTIAPVAEMVERVEQWNVSPKLENSANTPAARDVCSALRVFASLPKAHFKFVVVEPEDVREVEGVASRYGIARERILLMPEAADAHTLRERGGWLAELCATSGYRFGPRLHIGLWGNERGR